MLSRTVRWMSGYAITAAATTTTSATTPQSAIPILRLGDARLRQRAGEVKDVKDPEFLKENGSLASLSLFQCEPLRLTVDACMCVLNWTERLHRALSKFRADNGFGRGVAAPQIGCLMRFIALNLGLQPPAVAPCKSPFTV